MKVFVTGGSGFLGRHLIERLVRESWEVTGLARSEASASTIEQLGARPVKGSLDNVELWAGRLRGHDAVIHCAAPVEFWGPWEKFHREITLATKTLLELSATAGVKRFVHISSESVLQDTTALVGIDESFPYARVPNSNYGRAKKLAELEILNSQSSVHCVIVRPTFIWGKGMTAIDEIARKIEAGQFMWVGKGETIVEMVHVDNVVEAIVLACTRGRDRGIYFVTDDAPKTVKELLSALLATRAITPPQKNLPNGLVKWISGVVEKVWRWLPLSGPPPISRFEWSFVGLPRKYNISRAKQELGYRPIVNFQDGLKEMLAEHQQ